MLDITLLVVGKIKEKYWQAAFLEYAKRLKPYARLRVVELAAAPFSKNDKEKAKGIESGRILDFLQKSASKSNPNPVYLLAERGRVFSSPAFAAWLDKNQSLLLVVGGALGFSDELYRRYPQISLSPLTFPHELARVVLLEQLYRAATIINNKDYHY
jgi:23S rRNA (pseudouridine1915-N3)-methyltransferase